MKTTLTAKEKRVLEALAEQPEDFGFLHFKDLRLETGLPIKTIRKACRALAGKGLAQLRGGLWTEDGEMYGSGYGITDDGGKAYTATALSPVQSAGNRE